MRICRMAMALGTVVAAIGCGSDAVGPPGQPLGASPAVASDIAVVPGQFIVVLKEGAGGVRAAATSIAAANGGRVLDVLDVAIRAFLAELPAGAQTAVARDSRVAYVEPNPILHVPTLVRNEVHAVAGEQPSAPWNLDRIDQRYLPLNGLYASKRDGAGVHAYLIGSGIRRTHSEFYGRILPGYSFFDDNRGMADCLGQGTAIAGVIGGKTYGVAKQVWMHPVRVVDCAGVTYGWFVLYAVNWVALNRIQPAVAEISFAFPWMIQSLNEAITNAVQRNVEVVVAAGDANSDACLVSPASAPEANTVAGTTITDDRVPTSNIGRCLDFFAPSDGVTTSWYTGDTDRYTGTGTWLATAHVAGGIALLRQAYPFIPAPSAGLILRNWATFGVVKDPGPNSPNYFLFLPYR